MPGVYKGNLYTVYLLIVINSMLFASEGDVLTLIQDCVVRVYNEDIEQYGVIIDPSGIVLTVAHGVQADHCSIRLRKGKAFAAKLLFNYSMYDIAYLKIKSNHLFPYAKVRNKRQQDHQIYMAKMNKDFDSKLFHGNIYMRKLQLTNEVIGAKPNFGKEYLKVYHRAFFYSIETEKGDSGCPIFDREGYLIGINILKFFHPNISLSLAIPAYSMQEPFISFPKLEKISWYQLDRKPFERRISWFLDGLVQHFVSVGVDRKMALKVKDEVMISCQNEMYDSKHSLKLLFTRTWNQYLERVELLESAFLEKQIRMHEVKR